MVDLQKPAITFWKKLGGLLILLFVIDALLLQLKFLLFFWFPHNSAIVLFLVLLPIVLDIALIWLFLQKTSSQRNILFIMSIVYMILATTPFLLYGLSSRDGPSGETFHYTRAFGALTPLAYIIHRW